MSLLQTLRYHPLGDRLKQLILMRVWEFQPTLLFRLGTLALISSLLLGGGTHGGFLSDSILQLCAIPAFLFAVSLLVALPRSDSIRRATWPLMLCLAIAIVPLIQLVPLPPWIWMHLPGRERIVNIFSLIGRDPPWLPISVSSTATWVSVLSLLSPIAIFLCVIQLNYRERRSFSVILIGFGVVSAFVGIVQVAQGPSSPLRFFADTSDVEAVGFFANTNHFAAFMYALLLFSAAWLTDMAFVVAPWKNLKNLESSSVAALTGIFLILVVFVACDAMTRSRAGLGLMIVAVFGAIALVMKDRRRPPVVSSAKIAIGAGLLLLLLFFQFGLYRLSQRFGVDPLADARIAFARNTIAAAKAYMPFGSGFGTFVMVYPSFEPVKDTIANVFANRAHNDFLEIWLEGGVISILLVAAFLLWFLGRAKNIWSDALDGGRPIDVLLMRAATIAIPLVMLHSLVDYPLRTEAMMAVFAFACALLVEPLAQAPSVASGRPLRSREAGEGNTAGASTLPVPPIAVPPVGTPAKPRRSLEPWGEGIEWPESWRK
jgi:O-antigen ligase